MIPNYIVKPGLASCGQHFNTSAQNPQAVAAARQSAANLKEWKNAAFCRKLLRLFCKSFIRMGSLPEVRRERNVVG
jgi:hypothetical protein